jgi:predicted O-methyltransferase YrrM
MNKILIHQIFNKSLTNRRLLTLLEYFKWAPILHNLFTVFARYTSIQLSKKANRCKDIEGFVNLAFGFVDNALLSITPSQEKMEIRALLRLLAKKKPKFVLEIGSQKGGTLFLFSKVSKQDALIISIDLPGGFYGGGYPIWKIPLYKSFALSYQKIMLVRENSHFLPTRQLIETILGGHELDFLFVDADHSYEGVKLDFQMYSSLVRKGGLIAFHDICKNPSQEGGDVNRFWNEIKREYSHQEIISSPCQERYGIGIIYN